MQFDFIASEAQTSAASIQQCWTTHGAAWFAQHVTDAAAVAQSLVERRDDAHDERVAVSLRHAVVVGRVLRRRLRIEHN